MITFYTNTKYKKKETIASMNLRLVRVACCVQVSDGNKIYQPAWKTYGNVRFRLLGNRRGLMKSIRERPRSSWPTKSNPAK